jgi:hypothetical protein
VRTDVAAYPDADFERSVEILLYQGDSVADVLDGVAVNEVDITEFVTSAKVSESSLRVSIAYSTEFLACAAQPKVGHLLVAKTDSQFRFIGIVSSIDGFHEERGERRIDLTSRTREAVGSWKTQRAVSPIFPLGTNLSIMLSQVCKDLMSLKDSEFIFPGFSYSVPHANIQFNEETPWNMLTTTLEAASHVPFVNVLNQVKSYSKELINAQTLPVDLDRLISKTGTSQRISYDRVRLRWLDQKLQRTSQQSQVLYSTAMTAGFFDRVQEEETWWSDDRRQRAENTFMKVLDSVNSGILPVATEDYRQVDLFHGEIELVTRTWVPAVLVMASVTLLTLAAVPDGVAISVTVPIGRIAQVAAISSIMLIQMSIGVGRYEIWGVPFDFVHAKNTTLAYADTLPTWLRQEKEIDNDLILNEDHAQSVAVTDLVFESSKATTTRVELVDDPRIEIGDLLEFSDGTRMFVSSFSSDLTRGSSAVMQVEGMIV